MFETTQALTPLARLLVAHARGDACRHACIWALDARLADIVRTTSEPLIGQMRLTWWHDVLTDTHDVKGRGDPLVDAMRTERIAGPDAKGLLSLIDGWERLLEQSLDDAALRGFAEERGGGLFRALAGEPADAPKWLGAAGAVWALWDLSGHVSDGSVADRAIALARDRLAASSAARWPGPWKPLRIAFGLARHDVIAGRRAPASLTPGLYARLVRVAFFGR